jgi:Sap-like sulfolipid-1-addressing protein
VASLYLVVGGATLVFFGRTLRDLSTGTIIIDAILVVVGVFLLVLAARSFFIAPNPDAPPPGWMRRITTLSAGQAFLFGIILACSVRYLLIFLSGVALIYETGVSPSQGAIALLVLITLTLLCQIILVSLYIANADRARVRLSALMEWLTRHNRAIMTALFLALGVIFLVKGFQGLIPIPVRLLASEMALVLIPSRAPRPQRARKMKRAGAKQRRPLVVGLARDWAVGPSVLSPMTSGVSANAQADAFMLACAMPCAIPANSGTLAPSACASRPSAYGWGSSRPCSRWVMVSLRRPVSSASWPILSPLRWRA